MPWYSPFLFNIVNNIRSIFTPRALVWHALAILLTLLLVVTDADWIYYASTRGSFVIPLAWGAGLLGFFIPMFLPLALLIQKKTREIGYALVQAQSLAWLLSAFYKTFTGRAHPPLPGVSITSDITHQFAFGFARGGIFWGWPSSHTIVAVSLAACVCVMTRNMWARILAVVFGAYIAIGASLTFHWLSDAVAGVILGTLVGVIVGRAFKNRIQPTPALAQ